MIDYVLPLAATRLAIAGLLGAGALHKARNFPELRAALSAYVSDTPFQGSRAVTALAMTVGATEAIAAVAIASAWMAPFTLVGALLGAFIFFAYAAVMVFNIARGNRIADCGCAFGGQQKQAVSPALVVRNLILMMVSATVAVPTSPKSQDVVDILGFAVLLLLIYAIWNEINANSSFAGEHG